MKNIEWLIENNLWFRDVCCSVVYLMGVDAKPLTLREWLMAEHDEARERYGEYADLAEYIERDGRKRMEANTEETLRETPVFDDNPQKSACSAKNDAQLDANGTPNGTCPDDCPDSREKLEADARSLLYDVWADGWELGSRDAMGGKDRTKDVLALLDRQAAITEHDAFLRGRASLDDELAEMHEDVKRAEKRADELEAERDRWKAECNELDVENIGLQRAYDELVRIAADLCGACGFQMVDASGEVVS